MRTSSIVADIIDGVLHALGMVLLLPWMPVEATIRAARQVVHRRRIVELRREHEATAYGMRLDTQRSVDFLTIFLRRHAELQRRVRLQSDARTPRDARIVLEFYELAERQLIEEARRAADVAGPTLIGQDIRPLRDSA